MNKDILLELKNAVVQFGGVKALNDVSISLDEGEMVVLLGPNGAGKSTALKSFFGLVPISQGSVLYHGSPIKPQSHQMVQRGIALVPQGRRVFSRMTVEENLYIGGSVTGQSVDLERRLDETLKIFPVLRAKFKRLSSELSGGEQQMLALARGLMTDPKVLLLDEPTLGLAPKVVSEVFLKIREINERHGVAVMVVEHNIRSVLKIVQRGYVLSKGSIVFSGTSDEIRDSDLLRDIFLN